MRRQVGADLKELGFAVQFFPGYENAQRRLHQLDVVLMQVVLSGTSVHHLADRTFRQGRGAVGITHYGEAHDILTDPPGIDVYNIYVDLRHHPLPVLPAALQPALSAVLPLHPSLRHEANRCVHFELDDVSSSAQVLTRIDCETTTRAAGWQQVAADCFRTFLVDCCRSVLRTGLVPSTAQDSPAPWVERLRRAIDANPTRRFRLRDLAARYEVSPAYLCRAFRRYTGQTLLHYVALRRVQVAMVQLRSGRDKVSAVAWGSGFGDLAHFNRTFKRIVGVTPSAYRATA